jgi:DNA processing protein
MSSAGGLDAQSAAAAALAGLPMMTVSRLGALLRSHPPTEAWQVAAGKAPPAGAVAGLLATPELRSAWRTAAVDRRLREAAQRCTDSGIDVVWWGHPAYPVLLLEDPLPPPVLFVKGSLQVLEGRRVGVVGTRNATAAGRVAARQLGEYLGLAGVHVVSGLARGIDGQAHRGLLCGEGPGRPIGVVASGLDVVYPREHRDLWHAVAEHGLLLSEAPPGTSPEAYRFPLRNRVVAALSEVLVVVESRERGGSLLTASAALERGVPVMAVPGSVGNRAASGTNALLRDGAAPVLDADDVLTALCLDHRRHGARVHLDPRPRPRGSDEAVYRALQREPRTLDGLALATASPLVEVAMAAARLELAGWVACADGWYECIGSPLL